MFFKIILFSFIFFQLCLALGHVAARTNLSDLQILWPEIKDHVQDVAIHIKHFQVYTV